MSFFTVNFDVENIKLSENDKKLQEKLVFKLDVFPFRCGQNWFISGILVYI